MFFKTAFQLPLSMGNWVGFWKDFLGGFIPVFNYALLQQLPPPKIKKKKKKGTHKDITAMSTAEVLTKNTKFKAHESQ